MLVNFAIRKDYLTNRGGDTFQLLKTIEYLEKYGDIHCKIVSDPEKIDSNLDILHIFNLQNASFAYTMEQAAKKKKAKVVISPIVWECKIVCVNRYCMNLLYAPYWGKQR